MIMRFYLITMFIETMILFSFDSFNKFKINHLLVLLFISLFLIN